MVQICLDIEYLSLKKKLGNFQILLKLSIKIKIYLYV